MAQLKPYKGDYYLWDYLPSLPAAIAFAVIFLILTGAQLWRMVRSRLWFCIPLVTGGVLMVIGFAVRAICYNNTDNLGLFIMQGTLLVLPPAFFAATLYMSYTRVVRAVDGEACSLISSHWSTRVFLIADITCINVQGSGAGLLPSDSSSAAKAGQYILVGGLILHVLVFVCFIVLCTTFHLRYRAWQQTSGQSTTVPWKQTLKMLYATSIIITVRNIFRAVEYIEGREGYLMSNEWPLFVLDFGPMIAVLVAFYIWYPGSLGALKGQSMELTSQTESMTEPINPPKERPQGGN
ncbi:RTA1 like protein [Sarocladium implicatum]|nr:RTA1 like protein [Sarocladium implicatum]